MQGERGASLLLAIVFMVVVGAISAAVLATTASGLQDRVALDQARNREYAADGAIETAVTASGTTAAHAPAAGSEPDAERRQHSRRLHVEPVVHRPAGQHDRNAEQHHLHRVRERRLVERVHAPQPQTRSSTRQVNFQGTSAPLKTFVQSWSVNR